MDIAELQKKSNHRICPTCRAEFKTDKDKMALEKFCDHIMIHQHTVLEWTNAYNQIRRSMRKDA